MQTLCRITGIGKHVVCYIGGMSMIVYTMYLVIL